MSQHREDFREEVTFGRTEFTCGEQKRNNTEYAKMWSIHNWEGWHTFNKGYII